MFFLKKNKQKLILLAILVGALLVTKSGALASQSVTSAHKEWSTQVSTYLKHTPSGSADLKWDAKSESLTVTIKLIGLAQNSTHPAHIHLGDCDDHGPVKYMLNNVVADAAGVGTSTTVIKNVEGGIAIRSWSINVHNGPGLMPATQFLPIACGNIIKPRKANIVHVHLGQTDAQDQAVTGKARLLLKGDTLVVTVTAHGLVPNSKHAEHIHVGRCERQVPGSVIYMLQDLVADKYGNAIATTVIKGVKQIPDGTWYINIHRTTTLTNQTDFDPIACGNVENE